MIKYKGKVFRNEQEMIIYLAEEMERLKNGITISYWVDSIEGIAPLMQLSNVGKYVVVGSSEKTLYLITKRANEGLIAVPMGVYPAAVEGPKGEQGDAGENGERGNGVFGCSATLPSPTAYKEGDFYLLFNGELYKKISGSWLRQTTLKGPQGVPGPEGGAEVIANPVEAYTDELRKIKIDGTVFSLDNPYKYIITVDGNGVHFEALSEGEDYAFHSDVKFDEKIKLNSIENFTNSSSEPYFSNSFYASLIFASSVFSDYGVNEASANKNIVIPVGKYLKLDDTFSIRTLNGNPLIIIENFRDQYGHNRFISGNININNNIIPSGMTITYSKWVLSGNVLTFVVSGSFEANADFPLWDDGPWASAVLPEWIYDKIIPTYSLSGYLNNSKVRRASLSSSGISGNEDWNIAVSKGSGNIYFRSDNGSQIHVNESTGFRYQLTLIIDND